MVKVLGIDPGVTGAWALIEKAKEQERPILVAIGDLPVVTVQMSKRVTRRIDAPALREVLENLLADGHEFDRVVIERLSGGPGIAASTSFSMGWTAGVLDTMMTDLGIRYQPVSPSTWKRALAVPADKAAARRKATTIFGHDKGWPRQLDHNRAEAALIALYGAFAKK